MWNPRFWKLVELNGAQLNAARAATFRSKNGRKRREHRRWKRDAEWFTGAVFQYPPLFTLSLSMIFFLFFFVFLQYRALLLQDATSDELWKYWRFVGRDSLFGSSLRDPSGNNRHWIFIDGFPRNIDGSPVPMESVNFTPLWFHVWQIIPTMIGFVERNASNI